MKPYIPLGAIAPQSCPDPHSSEWVDEIGAQSALKWRFDSSSGQIFSVVTWWEVAASTCTQVEAQSAIKTDNDGKLSGIGSCA